MKPIPHYLISRIKRLLTQEVTSIKATCSLSTNRMALMPGDTVREEYNHQIGQGLGREMAEFMEVNERFVINRQQGPINQDMTEFRGEVVVMTKRTYHELSAFIRYVDTTNCNSQRGTSV